MEASEADATAKGTALSLSTESRPQSSDQHMVSDTLLQTEDGISVRLINNAQSVLWIIVCILVKIG